jgi:hypothetical protein
MKTSTASIRGLVYVLSEAALALKKRAKAGESRSADRAPAVRRLGIALFAAGLAIHTECPAPFI